MEQTQGGALGVVGRKKEAVREEMERLDIWHGKNSSGKNQCDSMTPLGVCFHCPSVLMGWCQRPH